jgi:hypothetical protein
MSDLTIDRLAAEAFERDADVARLSRESFILDEVAEALPLFPRPQVATASHRAKVFLAASPLGTRRFHRKFHLIDVYLLGLYLSFERPIVGHTDFVEQSRQVLMREVHHLLWGEEVTPAERLARSAEFAAKAERAMRSPAAKKRFDEFMLRLHENRRCELVTDIFSAPVHVWNRDQDRAFAIFLRRDVTLFLALFERGKENSLATDALLQNGFTGHFNLTKTLAAIDVKLLGIVERRNRRPPELVEAENA